MFGLVLFVLITSSFVIVLSLKLKWLYKIGQILLKSVFLYVYTFNLFNLSFSIGLHFKYATNDSIPNYRGNSVAVSVALLVSAFVLGRLTLFESMLYG